MIKVVTDYPIASNSIDHLVPQGTAQDNYTSLDYILEIEKYYSGKKINYLDLGCSGGQLVIDFLRRGHFSMGLEGSDYSIKNHRANWPIYNNEYLFTCDIAKPFKVLDDKNNIIKFNCISAWEVLEHIPENDLPILMQNIFNHLGKEGIFVGSISSIECQWHASVFDKDKWYKEIFSKLFDIYDYPFKNKVRDYDTSFYVLLKKKN